MSSYDEGGGGEGYGGEEGSEEQLPPPPSEEELQATIRQADIDRGGSGDPAELFASTTTNICLTFCFYAGGRIGQSGVYFSVVICGPDQNAVYDIVRRVYEYLRQRWPIARYELC